MTDTSSESKSCQRCTASFEITDDDKIFYQKISPTYAGQKFNIPLPTLCPDCRQQRRLSFRNERSLYKRKCDASGKDIISIYSPDKPYLVYDQKVRRSDDRDPLQYGREVDLTKPFTEQFRQLQLAVPRTSLYIDTNCENCDYTNQITGCKSCYMIFSCANAEEVLYSKRANDCKACMDCFLIVACTSCYSCINCTDCSQSTHLLNCQ
ncbi:MAG: hypothetical protein Q8O99_00440 [bacterium]|nr:hypothetical protein [bacterium]